MLRLIATERTALAIPPEPLRLLVLSVVHPASDLDALDAAGETVGSAPQARRLGARLSVTVGAEGPQVHLVHQGDRVQLGSRHFVVTAVREQSMLGACVEMDQVRAI